MSRIGVEILLHPADLRVKNQWRRRTFRAPHNFIYDSGVFVWINYLARCSLCLCVSQFTFTQWESEYTLLFSPTSWKVGNMFCCPHDCKSSRVSQSKHTYSHLLIPCKICWLLGYSVSYHLSPWWWWYIFFVSLIRELDVGAMRKAATLLVGVHDFSSFRAVNSELPFKNPVKTLDAATIQTGDSFAQAHYHR